MSKNREAVTCNGRAAFYACMWEDIRKCAMDCGWAVALHGSLFSDMDIMAMPWTNDAVSFKELANSISKLFDGNFMSELYSITYNEKPHGRIVATIPIYGDHYLDISTIEAVPVVWKPIEGFEGLYEISNWGQVRNNKGEIKKHGIKRTNGTCYKNVRLWKDGKYHNKYIHRLIAEAFIPNPENLPFINHKDEDGTNNLIENLEWCTREYNVNYGTAKARRAKKIRNVPLSEEHKKKISDSMKRHYNCGADMKGGVE